MLLFLLVTLLSLPEMKTGLPQNNNSIDEADISEADIADEESTCSSKKVFCRLVKEYPYQAFLDSRKNLLTRNLVHVADTNGDNSLDFGEFYEQLVSYLATGLDILDRDGDGSVDLETEAGLDGLVSRPVIKKLVLLLFEFFDMDSDANISPKDFGFEDKNLEEVIGQPLILLPGPVYQLYLAVDQDKNQLISRNETELVLRVVSSLLNSLDENGDCRVNFDEFVLVLQDVELERDYILALEMLARPYLSLASYLLAEVGRAADLNQDQTVNLEELLAMEDYSIVGKMISIVNNLGVESYVLPMSYLTGSADSSLRLTGGANCRHNLVEPKRTLGVWLSFLQGILLHPRFIQPAPAICLQE